MSILNQNVCLNVNLIREEGAFLKDNEHRESKHTYAWHKIKRK